MRSPITRFVRTLMLALMLAMVAWQPATAQDDNGPKVLRDTETELMVKRTETPGLHHVAFTFESMQGFLDNYVRLRDRGIRPFFCVNHGPTTSMYYRDPDGNRVELQIDNFATAAEGEAWMKSAAFYDPDQLVKRFAAGEPVAELVRRP